MASFPPNANSINGSKSDNSPPASESGGGGGGGHYCCCHPWPCDTPFLPSPPYPPTAPTLPPPPPNHLPPPTLSPLLLLCPDFHWEDIQIPTLSNISDKFLEGEVIRFSMGLWLSPPHLLCSLNSHFNVRWFNVWCLLCVLLRNCNPLCLWWFLLICFLWYLSLLFNTHLLLYSLFALLCSLLSAFLALIHYALFDLIRFLKSNMFALIQSTHIWSLWSDQIQ